MSCAEFTELSKQTCSSTALLGVGDEFHGRSKLEMRRRGKDGPLLSISDFSRASPSRARFHDQLLLLLHLFLKEESAAAAAAASHDLTHLCTAHPAPDRRDTFFIHLSMGGLPGLVLESPPVWCNSAFDILLRCWPFGEFASDWQKTPRHVPPLSPLQVSLDNDGRLRRLIFQSEEVSSHSYRYLEGVAPAQEKKESR